jgi:hypothetical protein
LADGKNATVGDLTGTRRRYSVVRLPEQIAQLFGADELRIEHYDEGISTAEIPYWHAFYQIKNEEQKRK